MDRFYVAANVPSSRMNRTLWICLVGSLFLCMSLVNAVPYTKYGRSCKDIGCRSTEVCVIKEDPCSYETRECGKYPTCVRAGSAGQPSCETKVCPVRQYCKTVNGIPTCVDTSPNLEFESAGVSSINGHQINGNSNQDHPPVHNNVNPYANANAPPLPPELHDSGSSNHRPANTGIDQGYPSYPSNAGNYPPYPATSGSGQQQRPSQTNNNLGYPPYPSQNRMPQAGNYPGHFPPNSGYPAYPSNQQPANTYPYANYPYNNRNYNMKNPYKSSASSVLSHATTFSFSILLVHLITKYLS